MRRGIQIALAILMIISAMSLSFIGCGGGEDGGPVSNETIRLKFSQPHPALPGYFGSLASEGSIYYWEEAVETVTEGRVDIELYTSETLNKQELAYDAVNSGIADIAWCITSYSEEWTPLSLVMYLPLDMESCEMNYQVYNYLYEDYFADEYEARDMIWITSLGREQYIMFSPYKRVDTIGDFKGATIMTSGKSMEQLISKLGGLSITLPWQDCYEALEKATLDCSALDITLPIVFRWFETGEPGYIIDCGGIGNAIPHYCAQTSLLTRLRPEDVYAVLKLTDVWLGVRGSQWSDAGNILYWDEVPKVGMEIIDWPESEKEKMRELKREVYDWFIDWIENDFGIDRATSEAALAAVLDAMENYEPGHKTPGNPASYPEQWMHDRLAEFGWSCDEWDEWVGPDGHWGMDYVYKDDWEPWYEEWWDEQNMEHPWYSAWKAEHGK